jgi:hypothetical protein
MPAPSRLAVTGAAQATGRYLTRRYTAVTSALPGPAAPRRDRAEWARLADSAWDLPELDAGLDRACGDEQERIRRFR